MVARWGKLNFTKQVVGNERNTEQEDVLMLLLVATLLATYFGLAYAGVTGLLFWSLMLNAWLIHSWFKQFKTFGYMFKQTKRLELALAHIPDKRIREQIRQSDPVLRLMKPKNQIVPSGKLARLKAIWGPTA